ncbi:hypothetical protein VC03_05915 [Sneathia vaginalis]|jgi:hypothetical protein|uniref:HicB-like antitoxin of toxin-antitoxin system domain-containing protein n=1 Tax=Sneathia vaginalis TaxID=187101 RepID=A0A0E3ZD47_9FUSO|nr:type II toxin-antitoxin system HicB family antitoxin [Sneathia vaginalis]AKC96005.1 hypothetical protein VC03_05915 [Sneathia vaginalis]
MAKEVIYPVIVTLTEDNFYEVNIPDFNLELGAYGETIEEAMNMALEVVSTMIYETGKIPSPSKIKELQKGLKENQFVGIVSFNPDYEYSLIKQVYKNKMVSLPSWLIELAKNKNINCSQLLQQALKKELKIKSID